MEYDPRYEKDYVNCRRKEDEGIENIKRESCRNERRKEQYYYNSEY